MVHHLRALILHTFICKLTVSKSSFIQTVLSAPESHRIMPQARGLYRRQGLSPCPEDIFFLIIILYLGFVKYLHYNLYIFSQILYFISTTHPLYASRVLHILLLQAYVRYLLRLRPRQAHLSLRQLPLPLSYGKTYLRV